MKLMPFLIKPRKSLRKDPKMGCLNFDDPVGDIFAKFVCFVRFTPYMRRVHSLTVEECIFYQETNLLVCSHQNELAHFLRRFKTYSFIRASGFGPAEVRIQPREQHLQQAGPHRRPAPVDRRDSRRSDFSTGDNLMNFRLG